MKELDSILRVVAEYGHLEIVKYLFNVSRIDTHGRFINT